MSNKRFPHRWSGWPGAWCLDCGIDDPWEVALADGKDLDEVAAVPDTPCPEPGSHKHDPYYHEGNAK